MAIDTPLYEEIVLVIGDSTKPYFGTVLDAPQSYQYGKDLLRATPSASASHRRKDRQQERAQSHISSR